MHHVMHHVYAMHYVTQAVQLMLLHLMGAAAASAAAASGEAEPEPDGSQVTPLRLQLAASRLSACVGPWPSHAPLTASPCLADGHSAEAAAAAGEEELGR